MRIFLLGATGNTGNQVLKQLIARGHSVKVLARNPARLSLPDRPASPAQITVVEGEVGQSDKLPVYLKDCDAVISALGTGLNNIITDIYSVGGRNILNAMRANGIRKLVTMTSASIDLTDPSTDTFLMNRVIRPNYNKVYYDQTRWETVLDETTDIDWICVRPPKLISKPFTGIYRVSLNHCPKGGWQIGHADLADFMVRQLTSDEYVRRKVVVAY
jgi:putative NADH-flavin reductase